MKRINKKHPLWLKYMRIRTENPMYHAKTALSLARSELRCQEIRKVLDFDDKDDGSMVAKLKVGRSRWLSNWNQTIALIRRTTESSSTSTMVAQVGAT